MRIGLPLGFVKPAGAGGGGPALTQNVRVLFVGDSTTVGVGADPTGVTDIRGARPFAPPAQAAAWLNGNGVPATTQSFFSDNSVGSAEWSNYVPEVSFVGSWASGTGGNTLGGSTQRWDTGESVTFAPVGSVDTVEFGVYRLAGGDTLRLTIDGVVHSNYPTGVTPSDFVMFTVNVPLGPHTFAFSVPSGSVQGPTFVHAYNSATFSAQVFNAGVRNRTSTQTVTNATPVSALPAIAVVNPDIVVVDIGINDWRQAGTSIATVTANIQTLISAAVAGGAVVILVLPNDISTYNQTTDAWSYAAVKTMYEGLQAANAADCQYIDSSVVYFEAGLSGATNPATRAAMAALNFYYDTLHPKAEVYAAEGAAIGAAIKNTMLARGWLA